MAILGKYKAEILREWYAPDTDANIIQIAIDAGLNSVQVSMNREQIAAERAGSTSLRSLVAEALRRGLSVSILQGYQSYSGSVMPTQAHLDQQKADFLWVLQNIPGISGFELEEPGLETGGSDPWSPTQVNAGNIMRPLLTKWFRDLKAICAGFPLVTERGWNAMSLNYDWNYNSGIDFAVINSERLMTYIALQVPASPLYFDAEVTRFKGYVPNLEVGVWINVQSGNVPARVQHYYDAKIPFEILELQGLRSQAAMIRAILPAPPLPTQGTLNVTSTPSGANVLLSNNGGVSFGMYDRTPRTKTDMTPGAWIVSLALAGYPTYTVPILIVAGQTVNIDHTFTIPPPTTGKVLISCTPQADITINGAYAGKTDHSLSGVPGSYVIALSAPTYDTLIDTITIKAGDDLTKAYVLVKSCVPAWACETPLSGYQVDGCGHRQINTLCDPLRVTEIRIIGCNEAIKEGQTCQLIGNCFDQNNAPIACSQLLWGSSNAALATVDTNGKVTGVSAGAVTIAAVKGTVAGYRDVTILTSKGSLNASSSPAGAKILINDIDTGKVTPALITGILEGQISIKLVKSGFVDIFDTAEIVAGQTITKAYTMVAVIENGTLNVSSIPSNAYIIVDDVPLKEVTPQIVSLPPGRHIIKLVLSGYDDVNDSEYFYEGQQIIKLYTLQKKSSGIASLAIPITLGLGLLSLLKK